MVDFHSLTLLPTPTHRITHQSLLTMKSLTLLSTLATLFIPAVFAGPISNAVNIQVFNGEKTGRHIVTLKSGVEKASVLGAVTGLLAGKDGLGVTQEWSTVLNGFAGKSYDPIKEPEYWLTSMSGKFDEATLASLQTTPGVESISEDGVVHASTLQCVYVTALWVALLIVVP